MKKEMVDMVQLVNDMDKRIGRSCTSCGTTLTKKNIRKNSGSLKCNECLNKVRRKNPPIDRTICNQCGDKLTQKNKVWFTSKKGTKCFRGKCYTCYLEYNKKIQRKMREKSKPKNTKNICKDCGIEITQENKSLYIKKGNVYTRGICKTCQKEKTKQYNKQYRAKNKVTKKPNKQKPKPKATTRPKEVIVKVSLPPEPQKQKLSSVEKVFDNIEKNKQLSQKLSAEEKMMQEFIKNNGVTKVTYEDSKNRNITFHDY